MNKFTILILFLIFTSNTIKSILPKESEEEKKKDESKFFNGTLYSIEILNSNFEKSTINLIPGVYEKIYLKVTKLQHKLKFDIPINLELNSNVFKINNPNNEIHINTKENSFFETYIGISEYENKDEEYDVSFKVKNNLIQQIFDIKTFKVKVLNEKKEIKYELLENEISKNGYSYIKFDLNDINPINPQTKFTFTINEEDKEYLEIENQINIKKEKKTLVKIKAKKYNETKNTFTIKIESNNKNIIPKNNEFTIKINNEENPKFTNDIQKDIISSVKIVESKEENAIEIDMLIPYGGLFIECDAKHGKGNDFDFKDLIEGIIDDKNEEEKNYKVKDYIKKNNMTEYKLIFSNLYRLGVYRIKCHFTPTYEKSKDFNIKIGFSEEADIKAILRPNSFYYNLPQCIDFYFDKNENLNDYNSLFIEYFYSQQNNSCIMITERDLNSIFTYDNQVKSFCIDINPLCLFNNVKEKIEDITKNFLDKINTIEKINETLGIEIKNNFTYKIVKDDKIPDKSLIKINVTKEINSQNKQHNKVNITIKLKNENENPIICQYNDLKEEKEKSRWINPLNFQKEIYIKDNEEKILIQDDKIKNDKIYSIIINCGNLPGYKYHYYTTGPYIAGSVFINKEEEKDYEKKEKKDCNKDWFNPECIARKNYEEKKKNKKEEIDKFKSDIPKIIDDVLDEISDFGFLDLKDQRAYLKKQKDELKNIIKEKKKEAIVKQVYKMFKQMLKNECYQSENFDECRKEKKLLLKETLKEIKNIFNCNSIIEDIKNINENNTFVENVKVVLALISSASDNSDSLNEGDSQILYNLSYCVLDKYEEIWKKTSQNIKELKLNETEKLNIEKDIIQLIIQSISNLMDVIKYDEVDKFLENYNVKNLTQILVSQTAKLLKKKIHQASKLLWKFGNGNYSIENIDINITKIDESEKDDEKKIFDFPEHGIKLRIKKKKLLKKFKADLMQVLIYRKYPYLSVNSTQSENKFISIRFFKGDNEINVTDINNDDRPEILYDKNKMNFKKCVYYNENENDLKNDGIETENEKDSKEYIVCKVKHFTDFSISNSEISNSDISNDNKSNFWKYFFIIIFVVILIVAGIFVFMKMRNPVTNSDIDTNNIPNEKIFNV